MLGDVAYDISACHATIKVKGTIALTPPQDKGQPSRIMVILEALLWVTKNHTTQIKIGKNGIETTKV